MQSFRGRISGDEEWKALRGETGKTAGTGCAVPPTATVTDTATDTATVTATAATAATSTVSVLASSSAPDAAKESDIKEEGGSKTLSRIDIPFSDDDDDDDDGDSRDEGITDKIESRETVSESDSDTTKPSGTQIITNLGDKHTEIVRGTDRVTLKFITLGGERAVGGVPFDSTQYLWSAVENLPAPMVSDRGVSGEQGRGDGIDRGKDTQLTSTSSSASTSLPSSSTSSSADLCIEAAVARITSIQQIEDKRFHRSSSSSAATSSRPAIATHTESVSPSAASVWQNMRVSEVTIFTGERSV
jgi:hypothetical protein